MGWHPTNIFGPRPMRSFADIEGNMLEFQARMAGIDTRLAAPEGATRGSLTGGVAPPPAPAPIDLGSLVAPAPGAAEGVGAQTGQTITAGVEAELRTSLPAAIQRALEEAMAGAGITFRPRITIRPEINMGGLNGIHADVGPSVTR